MKNGTEFDGTVKIGEISPSTISKRTKPKTMCERESRFQAPNTNRYRFSPLSLSLSLCVNVPKRLENLMERQRR